MLLWTIVIVAAVAVDFVSKLLVATNMELFSSIPLIPDFLSFTRIHNNGAAWGILSGQRWIFLVVTGIAIIGLPILLYRYRKLHFLFGFSLSLIIGGAIGNMIDRLTLGYVIDFIDVDIIMDLGLFEIHYTSFPIFNVADIFVTVGTAIMIVYILFFDKTFFADKKASEEKTSKKDV